MRPTLKRGTVWLALALVLGYSRAAFAQRAPLQSDVTVQMTATAGDAKQVISVLEGGGAVIVVRVTNRVDPRTATVALRFRYAVAPDTIALDEIIDRIVAETFTNEGDPIGRAVIDPNDINLNPNSSNLSYRLTLYRPAGRYQVHVRVFGNYE